MDQLQKRIIIEGLGISDYVGDNMKIIGGKKYVPDHDSNFINRTGIRNNESINAPRDTVMQYEEALGISIVLKYKHTAKQFNDVERR